MRLLVYVVALVRETALYGFAARRWSLVVAVVLGIVAVALAFAVKVAAPVAIYPFA